VQAHGGEHYEHADRNLSRGRSGQPQPQLGHAQGDSDEQRDGEAVELEPGTDQQRGNDAEHDRGAALDSRADGGSNGNLNDNDGGERGEYGCSDTGHQSGDPPAIPAANADFTRPRPRSMSVVSTAQDIARRVFVPTSRPPGKGTSRLLRRPLDRVALRRQPRSPNLSDCRVTFPRRFLC
jgi:hypothetical protein